jgi:hypothetical protein
MELFCRVQTFIQIKHYKNTLNSKIYVQLYLQMMNYCSRVMSQFKNNQKINIWSSSTMVVHPNNPTLHLVPLDNHFKGIKRHPSLLSIGLFCFFRFETSFDSNVRFTQTDLVTWNCFVECRVFRCFRCVNFLFSRIESWNPLDESYSEIFRELHWWDWEV